MECARCGEEIDPSEGLPVPTRTAEGKPGYLCASCASEVGGEEGETPAEEEADSG